MREVICLQPACGVFLSICLRTREEHVHSRDTWTALSPSCQSVKLFLLITALILATGCHVFFALDLANHHGSFSTWSSASHLPGLGLTTEEFCEVCVSSPIIKAELHCFSSLPPETLELLNPFVCPFYYFKVAVNSQKMFTIEVRIIALVDNTTLALLLFITFAALKQQQKQQ